MSVPRIVCGQNFRSYESLGHILEQTPLTRRDSRGDPTVNRYTVETSVSTN